MKEVKLSPKQQAFCDYYIEIGNATEAAKKAGYKGSNLNRIASENLSKLVIKQYIEKRLKELESKRVATATEVLEFITSVMRGEVKDQFDLDASLQDRLKASEMLAKRFRLFDKDVDKDNEGYNVTIIDDLGDSNAN